MTELERRLQASLALVCERNGLSGIGALRRYRALEAAAERLESQLRVTPLEGQAAIASEALAIRARMLELERGAA